MCSRYDLLPQAYSWKNPKQPREKEKYETFLLTSFRAMTWFPSHLIHLLCEETSSQGRSLMQYSPASATEMFILMLLILKLWFILGKKKNKTHMSFSNVHIGLCACRTAAAWHVYICFQTLLQCSSSECVLWNKYVLSTENKLQNPCISLFSA